MCSCSMSKSQTNLESTLYDCWLSQDENIKQEIASFKSWLVSKELLDTNDAISFKESFIKLISLETEIIWDDFHFKHPKPIDYVEKFNNCVLANRDEISELNYKHDILFPIVDARHNDFDLIELKEYYEAIPIKEYRKEIVQDFLIGKLRLSGYQVYINENLNIEIVVDEKLQLKMEDEIFQVEDLPSVIQRIKIEKKEHLTTASKKLNVSLKVHPKLTIGALNEIKAILIEEEGLSVTYSSDRR